MTLKTSRFLRLPDVLAEIGLSAAQAYRLIAAGNFPKPVVLGQNSRAWLEAEVQAWKAARITDRDTGADAELRAVNPNIGRGRRRKEAVQRAA